MSSPLQLLQEALEVEGDLRQLEANAFGAVCMPLHRGASLMADKTKLHLGKVLFAIMVMLCVLPVGLDALLADQEGAVKGKKYRW